MIYEHCLTHLKKRYSFSLFSTTSSPSGEDQGEVYFRTHFNSKSIPSDADKHPPI